jgi:hypothetical protein
MGIRRRRDFTTIRYAAAGLVKGTIKPRKTLAIRPIRSWRMPAAHVEDAESLEKPRLFVR